MLNKDCNSFTMKTVFVIASVKDMDGLVDDETKQGCVF